MLSNECKTFFPISRLYIPTVCTVSMCNFTLCILRRVSKFLAESFDILLMGDMFFDENLGGKLSNLARTFKETCPKSKMVLIGDPGRWLLSEQKNRVFQSTLI